MANTVRMQAPVGFTGQVSVSVSTPPTSGQTYTPDANGTIAVDPRDVEYLLTAGFTFGFGATADLIKATDNGVTKTLTAALISGAGRVYLPSAGGTTPSLTLPTGALLDAAIAGMQVGQSYLLRVINRNSGTMTIVTAVGWTLTGTLTIATNAWAEFVITKTAAGTFTAVQVGTGAAV